MSKLYDLLTANIKSNDYLTLRKEIVVRVFLYMDALILSVFAVINFFVYYNAPLFLIDSLAAVIAFYAISNLNNKNINVAINIGTFNLFFFFLVFAFFNKNQDNGYVWLIFLPIFIIPLSGYKKGPIISLIFYAIVFVWAYFGIGTWQNGQWNMHSYIRFVVSSLVLVYVVYIAELAIYRSNKLLNEKEREKRLYMDKLQNLVQKDYLTGVFNRRRVSELLLQEFKKSYRYEVAISVAIVDIDFFKKVNDTYGHNVGDMVLSEFAALFQNSLRETDIFGRWGGEEFLIVFVHTAGEDACVKCEKLRQEVASNEFQEVGSITCSIGVSSMENNEYKSYEALVDAADKALYNAKKEGRNRVIHC